MRQLEKDRETVNSNNSLFICSSVFTLTIGEQGKLNVFIDWKPTFCQIHFENVIKCDFLKIYMPQSIYLSARKLFLELVEHRNAYLRISREFVNGFPVLS